MKNKIENLYQLRKTLLELHGDYYTPKSVETFIKNVTCAFAPKDYFKDSDKNQYNYTDDFARLVLTLAELNKTHDLHTCLIQCKKRSISYNDMEHFFYLLLNYENDFSQPFVKRIHDVLFVIHALRYNSKQIKYITDKKIIIEQLLFYLVAKNNHNRIKITKDLILSKLQKKLFCEEQCEI